MSADLYALPTMGEYFRRALTRNPPDAVAVWDANEVLTFARFEVRVRAFCDAMREAGLKRGDALAQLSLNKVDALCAIAAGFLLGLRYTPLHPASGVADHAFILQDAGINALVIDEGHFSDRADAMRAAMPAEAVVFSHRAAAFGQPLNTDRGAPGPLRCDADALDIALIAYTGGTTGQPKGVVHRHRSLVANLAVAMGEWEWRDPVRFLAVTPISHAAFLFALPVLLRGGSFGLSAGFSPGAFATVVAARSVTATFLVPTMIYALLDAPESVRASLAKLDTVIYGAAPIAPERLAAALDRFGPIFAQLYGQTEAPNAVSMLFKRDHTPDRLGSCGVALSMNDVALLDELGAAVGGGEVGELCVRGPLVMEGYWNRPEETAHALRDGWLRTGDLARRDARGYLYLVDRKKDMLISGGFNIYPREVEDALNAHTDVAQSCVAGVMDEKWGEACAALVVLRPGAVANADALAAHVKALKGPILTPKFILFAQSVPVTGLGKPDRKAARTLLAEAYLRTADKE